MNFRKIIGGLLLAATGFTSVYATYLNFKETVSQNFLLTGQMQDTTLLVLYKTPDRYKKVKMFVESKMTTFDQSQQATPIALQRIKAQRKQHLFPLNTNNEEDTSFLLVKTDLDIALNTSNNLPILLGDHLDTASLTQLTFNIDKEDQLYLKRPLCTACDSIKAYGNCFVEGKDEVQFVFYTQPMDATIKQPYMIYMPLGEDVVPITSETRRFFAEDLPKDIPVSLAAKTLVDVHVFNLNCTDLMQRQEGEEEAVFSSAQFQLMQPSLLWNKPIPLVALPTWEMKEKIKD